MLRLIARPPLFAQTNTKRGSPLSTQTRKYSQGPLNKYSKLISDGILRPDEVQLGAMTRMHDVWKSLEGYSANPQKPMQKPRAPVLPEIDPAKAHSPSPSPLSPEPVLIENVGPKGIYLHGDVGTGKTCLMDIFYSTLSTPKKRRVHFHTFMQELHKRMHLWREKHRDTKEAYDPMVTIAYEMAQESHLIYFDEFQLNDVVDAAFISRLFTQLLKQHGCVLLATSNRHPDDLCAGVPLLTRVGQPMVEAIFDRCQLLNLNKTVDYRYELHKEHALHETYLSPCTDDNQRKFEQQFRQAIGNAWPDAEELTVSGDRKITLPRCSNGVTYLEFDEFCGKAYGNAEFSAIAARYHTVFLSGVRKMTIKTKATARRFIVLIDALYNAKCKLYCTAEVAPEELFAVDAKKYDANVQQLEVLDELQQNLFVAVPTWTNQREKQFSVIITAEEESFMFRRAVSRLREMQSKAYQSSLHVSAAHLRFSGTAQDPASSKPTQ